MSHCIIFKSFLAELELERYWSYFKKVNYLNRWHTTPFIWRILFSRDGWTVFTMYIYMVHSLSFPILLPTVVQLQNLSKIILKIHLHSEILKAMNFLNSSHIHKVVILVYLSKNCPFHFFYYNTWLCSSYPLIWGFLNSLHRW